MRIVWEISEDDIARVQSIVDEQKNDPFVFRRVQRNLASAKPPLRKERVWQELVNCLLTTQQRSGPMSAVARFARTRPFPLSYTVCRKRRNLESFAVQVISKFGGIRWPPKLGAEIAENFSKLEGELWSRVLKEMRRLIDHPSRATEVEVANFLDQSLVGFGPKQARNLLQDLGLTRYEIPIDSRIAKWLKDIGFPASLSPAALSDRDYYHFISTAVVELCKRSGVLPCVFDAAVFSSFDDGMWTEEMVRVE